MEIGSYQEMGTLMLLRLSISTFLSVLLPFVAIAEEPNALTPSQSAAGWVSLFDGESPRGWRGYRKDAFPKQGWFVEDGWLRVIKAGGGGDIVTVDQFDDFILEMEWKAGKGANSGIMYLTNENNGAPYESAPEYQVLDIDDLTSSDSTSAGGLYGLYSPMNKKQNPTGEINHTRIVHCGGYIEHWLNGVRVLKAKIGSLDWNRRVANSKFAAWKDFGTVKKGHICLQDHNDSDLWYRSIKIREIPATERWRFTGESELLFNGRNLDGWDAFLNGSETKDQVWSVKDGILTCKG
ncbi:MAG: 3-keto-disaccharide hydrolase, partial [Planctomycetota bacterium]